MTNYFEQRQAFEAELFSSFNDDTDERVQYLGAMVTEGFDETNPEIITLIREAKPNCPQWIARYEQAERDFDWFQYDLETFTYDIDNNINKLSEFAGCPEVKIAIDKLLTLRSQPVIVENKLDADRIYHEAYNSGYRWLQAQQATLRFRLEMSNKQLAALKEKQAMLLAKKAMLEALDS